jgi:hypothetical protein
MNNIASTKNRSKLIIADEAASNAIILEYIDNGCIHVSSLVNGTAYKAYLSIDTSDAKQAIIDYINDHL